jgi:hypothetical protein
LRLLIPISGERKYASASDFDLNCRLVDGKLIYEITKPFDGAPTGSAEGLRRET